MKVNIKNKNKKEKNFKDIKVGDLFFFGGEVYIKTDCEACEEENICLNDGLSNEFNWDTEVIPIEKYSFTVEL